MSLDVREGATQIVVPDAGPARSISWVNKAVLDMLGPDVTMEVAALHSLWIGLWIVRPRFTETGSPAWAGHTAPRRVQVRRVGSQLVPVRTRVEWVCGSWAAPKPLIGASEALLMLGAPDGPVLAVLVLNGRARMRAVRGTFTVVLPNPLVDVAARP